MEGRQGKPATAMPVADDVRRQGLQRRLVDHLKAVHRVPGAVGEVYGGGTRGQKSNYAGTLGGFTGLFNQALAGLSVEHIYDLIALAIGPNQEGRVLAAGRGLKQARLAGIKAYIERRLAGDLSIRAVALAYGLTERYVQRLFEQDGGTFSTYVLQRRLALAKRTLCEPASIGQSISLIAYDCGFHDVSHFNHMFKRAFGATPSDVRAAALEGGSRDRWGSTIVEPQVKTMVFSPGVSAP